MIAAISPWAATAADQLADRGEPVFTRSVQEYIFAVHLTDDSLWIVTTFPGGAATAFRTAYSPDNLVIKDVTEEGERVIVTLSSSLGNYEVTINVTDQGVPLLHYTVEFTPAADLLIPFWPRDIIVLRDRPYGLNTEGEVYVTQTGTRTGLIYVGITKPASGTFIYYQNLTALSAYCEQTKTSLASTVGGTWPELGFALPIPQEQPLGKNKSVIISDASIVFNAQLPEDQFGLARQYLDMLACLYKNIPKSVINYHDYPGILQKTLKDITHNKGCWKQHGGHPYLNAYVSDYSTPPEIMVQLAVLLPLYDYQQWSGERCRIIDDLCNGLPNFYDDKLKTVMRWLPAAVDQLDGSEEQKQPLVMDAWYLHHPLLNLSRMALKGDKVAKELFLNSIKYAIKVAHHFKYEWPVFYKMDTLEVVKAETQPGKGSEKDVAGIYAHVMLQAWELTDDDRYLNEAKKAAKTLKKYGFNIFYQANNTAFSAGAMLRLYKITKDEEYLNLSYLLIADIFKNISLWDCNYGYGKNFPNFFALFPLSDAPYTAVYEEQEGFSAMHDFLQQAADLELLPSVNLLLAEFIKYTVSRLVYYYPPMLPQDMLSDEVKTGEIDSKLWIALEDIHDGWEKSGAVGQEVYGAGLAFGVVPRHYIKVPDEDFLIFVDYPVLNRNVKPSKQVGLQLLGDSSQTCALRVIPTNNKKLPRFTISADTGNKHEVKGKADASGHLVYELQGNQQIQIKWQ